MEAEAKERILQLLKLRQSYRQQLRDVECSLEAATSIDSDQDDEGIEIRIEALRKELLAASTRLALKERMLNYLQFSNALRDVTARQLDDGKSSVGAIDKEIEASLRKKLERLDELGRKITKNANKMTELNCQLDADREKTLLIRARHLVAEMRALDESERERESCQNSELILKLQKTLERGRQAKCIVRKVFLSLIHSAQIDWYEDETLRTMLSLLGETEQ